MDSKLIAGLVECSRKKHAQPWPVCSFDEDFILVSEFSEIVGPRPVLTLPEECATSFNKNSFAVRIMSVDCTAPVTVDTDSKKDGFHIAGDTQVFLMEPSEGAVAYIHYFTLYDIHARGYVRPYCVAYVTNEHSKIMSNFALFRDYFSRVSAYFKYGNAMVFLDDLQRRLDYLYYTKRKLSENLNGIPVGKVYELPRDMKGFKFDDIEGCIQDTVALKRKMLQYLNEACFDEQKDHFHDADASFFDKDWDEPDEIDSMPPLEELDEKFGSLEPRSVGISSGRRFDIQLRDLQKLCEPSKEEAFGLLRGASYGFFKTQLLEELNYKNMPRSSCHGTAEDATSRGSNFKALPLSTNQVFLNPMKRMHVSSKKDYDETDHGENLSFMAAQSFSPDSIWTVSSCPSRNDSFEVIKATQGSSDEEYLSLKDTDSPSSAPVSITSVGSPGGKEPKVTQTERFPGTARRVMEEQGSRKENHGTKGESYKSDEVDLGNSSSPIRSVYWDEFSLLADDSKAGNREEPREKGSLQVGVKKHTTRQWSVDSNKSSSSNTSGSKSLKGKPSLHMKVRSDSKNSNGSSSSKDSVPSVLGLFQVPVAGCTNLHGISLMTLRSFYPFLPHLIYSLMIGRPLVVSADKQNKHIAQSLIVTLLPCVPAYPKNKSSVVLWTKGPLIISNLATLKLVGLLKSRGRGDPVPRSILPYVSVLDVENSTLTAPPYRGSYLNSCFDPQKEWPAETVFHDYLHSIQLDLSSQAMLMFSWKFAGYSDALSGSEIVLDKNPPSYVLKFDAQRFMSTNFAPDDVRIIQYLIEVVKNSFLCSYIKSIKGDEDGEECGAFSCLDHISKLSHCETPSVRLNLLKCQVFSKDPSGAKKK